MQINENFWKTFFSNITKIFTLKTLLKYFFFSFLNAIKTLKKEEKKTLFKNEEYNTKDEKRI